MAGRVRKARRTLWGREGVAFAVRHALAHLDWGHVDEPGPFTDEQCDAADDVAELYTGVKSTLKRSSGAE